MTPFGHKSATHNSARRALTLIEMLVGMAITLVMMAAVVNLFANISQGVKNRRATMEVSANLRIARARLYNDLAGATFLKYPKNTHGVMPKPDSNNPPDGYFEYVEGRRADENPGGLSNPETSLVPSTNRAFDAEGNPVTPGILTDGGGRGDFDDIIAMTVESQTERFRGKGRGLRPGGNPTIITGGPTGTGDWIDIPISSPLAEVVWFAVENPDDRSQGEPGMRKIYRRVVLIAPWYGTETKTIGANTVTGSDPLLDLVARNITDPELQRQALKEFQARYDISARLEDGRIVPNTLADLALRENRFAHAPNDLVSNPPINYFPHHFPYDIGEPAYPEGPDEDDSSLQPLGDIAFPQIYPPVIHQALFAETERGGEDLVLNDVLAFDVQVFDPGAPLYEYHGSIIPPSSSTAFTDPNSTNDAVGSGILTGFGAYVDLGWNNGRVISNPPPVYDPDYDYVNDILPAMPTAPAPLFQQERRLGWHPAFPNQVRGSSDEAPCVYDTWTPHYETDQRNQELAPFYSITNADPTEDSTVPWVAWQTDVADQGANGLDEDGLNGPDDPNERETSPPYPYPLMGVQVKIRVYEPESRQIKETTVTRNLAK